MRRGKHWKEERDARDGQAKLRFCVVAPLLSSPHEPGELQQRIRELSQRLWKHPDTGRLTRFAPSTIERWYYAAKSTDDPLAALRRRLRKDRGRSAALSLVAQSVLRQQHRDHPGWSIQLHCDNLNAALEREVAPGTLVSAPRASVSASTVGRFLRSEGLFKRKRRKVDTAGARRAEARFERLETRSYEQTHTGALWHLDFHVGSRSIVTRRGQRVHPVLLGILDDCSRLACHLQWYLTEDTESLVHGLCQAIQKRGLPRALMTDQGAAMKATETRAGLLELGIEHELTLPYSPHQNGKQESFWTIVEGRLLAMLEGDEDLHLQKLNDLTQIWVEQDYHRRIHSELRETPGDRYRTAATVLRPSPDAERLRRAFRRQETRRQRRSDGTVTVCGVRYEVPALFSHLRRVTLCYAAFDLRRIDLVDEATGAVLATLRPLDKAANAVGRRRRRSPGSEAPPPDLRDTAPSKPSLSTSSLPPYLEKLIEQSRAQGLPPQYLPSKSTREDVL